FTWGWAPLLCTASCPASMAGPIAVRSTQCGGASRPCTCVDGKEGAMLTTTAAGRVFDHRYCIGMYGMSGLGFWDPVDFALGANGVLYVVNRGGEELGQRISNCTTDHHCIVQFAACVPADGQLIG